MHGETSADDFFREDAEAQGYLAVDPFGPGYGRGLWAYYEDMGIVPPEKLERRDRGPAIITGLELDGIERAGLDGSVLPRPQGRHSRPENGEW